MKESFAWLIGKLILLAIAVGIAMFFKFVFWPTFRYMESSGQGWLFIIPFMFMTINLHLVMDRSRLLIIKQ